MQSVFHSLAENHRTFSDHRLPNMLVLKHLEYSPRISDSTIRLFQRVVVLISVTLLSITAILKLVGIHKVGLEYSIVFPFLPERLLEGFASIVEIGLVLLLMCSKNILLKFSLYLWTSAVFAVYHYISWANGSPCHCAGDWTAFFTRSSVTWALTTSLLTLSSLALASELLRHVKTQ